MLSQSTQVESCGIPHLAKNERDVGHPWLCQGARSLVSVDRPSCGERRHRSPVGSPRDNHGERLSGHSGDGIRRDCPGHGPTLAAAPRPAPFALQQQRYGDAAGGADVAANKNPSSCMAGRGIRIQAARASDTPAPDSTATVAPFRAWRGSQLAVAGEPARTGGDFPLYPAGGQGACASDGICWLRLPLPGSVACCTAFAE